MQLKQNTNPGFRNMPCCCETNIRAASTVGKVLLVISLFLLLESIISGNGQQVINGIANAGMAGLLIFGAEKHNDTSLLIWIILTCIGIVAVIILTLALIIFFIALPSISLSDIYPSVDWEGMTVKDLVEESGMRLAFSIIILFLIGATIFSIWTVIVANKARKEIKQGKQLLPVFQQGQADHQGQATEGKINMGPNQAGAIYKGQSPPPSYASVLQE